MGTSIGFYRNKAAEYGTIPILKTLQYFEEEEDYLECDKIYKSIVSFNLSNCPEEQIPTRFCVEIVELEMANWKAKDERYSLSDLLNNIEENQFKIIKEAKRRKKSQSK